MGREEGGGGGEEEEEEESVYFNSSHRAQTANIYLCKKVGLPSIPERAPKSEQKWIFFWKPYFLCRLDRDFPEELQGPPQPDLPLRHRPTRTPPPRPDSDPISTRFRPDSDLKRVISGRNQVEIRSKSGPNQVWAEGFSWVGARGVGPGRRVPVAPRKVSKIGVFAVWAPALDLKYTKEVTEESAMMAEHPLRLHVCPFSHDRREFKGKHDRGNRTENL